MGQSKGKRPKRNGYLFGGKFIRAILFFGIAGIPVLSEIVIFAGYYALAIHNRRRREIHKRMILLAAAVALGPAIFRITLFFEVPASLLVVFLAPALLIVGPMVHERRQFGQVHNVNRIGMPVIALVPAALLFFAGTEAGQDVTHALGRAGAQLSFLY